MATTTAAPEKTTKKKKSRFPRKLVLFGLLLALIWCAPWMVANSSLRHKVAHQVFSGINGEIIVGEASLSWFSPIVLHDVEFRDPDGEIFLTVTRVESERSLLTILTNLADVGLFTCESADLRVNFKGNTSNVEKALSEYFYPEDSSSSGSLAVEVAIENTTIYLHDRDEQRADTTIRLQKSTMQMADDDDGNSEIRFASQFQGDLQPLHSWLQNPAITPLSGNLDGVLKLVSATKQLTLDIDVKGKNVTIGDSKSPYWREKSPRIVGEMTWHYVEDNLEIRKLHVDSHLLQCDTEGNLAKLSSTQDLSLKGHVAYDLKKIEPMVQYYLGKDIDFSGKGIGPIELAASMGKVSTEQNANFLTELQGRTTLHWDTANLYGLQCGPAEVRGKLAKGWIQVQPVQTTVNQGKLYLQPVLRIDTWPMELYLLKGKMIEHARITPEMTSGFIKYALPALGTSVKSEGEISLDLEGAKIPFDDATKADIGGTFTIHQGRIQTSPLIRELAVLLNSPSEASLRKEMVVPFRMVNRRVYHEKMELSFPEITITTRGWVGLDGSLDMVAEFPIPPKWLGNNKFTQALAKERITIPIRGTMENPRLDAQSLNVALQNVLRNAGKNLLRNELENGLKKLFGPK